MTGRNGNSTHFKEATMRVLRAAILAATTLLLAPAAGHADRLAIGLTGHATANFLAADWSVAVFISDTGVARGHIRAAAGNTAISGPVVDAVPPGTGRPYWCASIASGESEFPFILFYIMDNGDGRTSFDETALANSAANCADTGAVPEGELFYPVLSGDFKTIP